MCMTTLITQHTVHTHTHTNTHPPESVQMSLLTFVTSAGIMQMTQPFKKVDKLPEH